MFRWAGRRRKAPGPAASLGPTGPCRDTEPRSMASLRFAACAVLFALSGPVAAQEAPAPWVVSPVTVVDVALGRLLEGHAVLVRGERIEALGPAAEVKPPQGARVIDGSGLFLMPGLFDAHVHYVHPESFGPLF